jgi:N-hydroxyarylamine O-acetyltransferase
MPVTSPYAPDLDAYFARIGYTGSREPTLATLRALSLHHASSIPFENLDVLLGRGIDLDPTAVERKLVHAHRGGYCFEQNSLFFHVLTALGFRVTPLSARVRWQRPRDFTPSRTHLFLRVDLSDGPWLADVGIGGLSLTSPIPFDDSGREMSTAHEPRRILREGTRLFHQARLGTEWHDVYEFTGEEMPPIDRELGNWYTSAHPASHFRNRLIAARATTDGRRLSLLNREFTMRARDGRAETHPISSPDELLALLAAHFGLEFSAGTRFGGGSVPWPV